MKKFFMIIFLATTANVHAADFDEIYKNLPQKDTAQTETYKTKEQTNPLADTDFLKQQTQSVKTDNQKSLDSVVMKMCAAMVFIVLLIAAMALFMKKMVLGKGGDKQLMQIKETMFLAPGKNLYIVQVLNEMLLLSCDKEGLKLLKSFPTKEVEKKTFTQELANNMKTDADLNVNEIKFRLKEIGANLDKMGKRG